MSCQLCAVVSQINLVKPHAKLHRIVGFDVFSCTTERTCFPVSPHAHSGGGKRIVDAEHAI